MANKYIIKSANEPNPEILADAYAELYLSKILKSDNPKEMYVAVLNALEQEIKLEE